MSGYIHDPLQIINLIADNIRDRYKTGFSVIKEIIQNADDSGSGNFEIDKISVEFGLSPGLPESDHPLLKGSSLFFFNNGNFSQSDAVAIRSFGLNRKAIDEATIGKFGLGMKSVFHFCEAFFFMAHDQGRDYAEILNPWSGPAEFASLHTEWDNFKERDATLLKSHLSDIVGSYQGSGTSWFLLWLPLRSIKHIENNGHKIGTIVAEFPGDDHSRLSFLRSQQISKRLARLLPLLRRIVSIRFWEYSERSASFESVYRISMDSPEARTKYPEIADDIFKGRIQFGRDNQTGPNHSLIYSGLEKQINSNLLENLRRSEFWPRSYVRDPNGQGVQAPDKARAHCAAVFSRCDLGEEPSMDIRWAVFLPIDTGRESIPINSQHAYCLTLHGYFFVDAGRAGVSGITSTGSANNGSIPGNEAELRQQWNENLATGGTLRLVIPALDDFVRLKEINFDETKNLCQALLKSNTFKQHGDAICNTDLFVLEMSPSGAEWSRCHSSTRLLPLPIPPADPMRPWKTFRYLGSLEGSPRFILDGAPHLVSSRTRMVWDDSTLEKVLDIDVAAVFQEQVLLSYFRSFLIIDSVKPLLQNESIQSRLVTILRSALQFQGRQLTRHKSLVQEIMSLIFTVHRFQITGQWSEVTDGILHAKTRVMMVPKELDSVSFPGSATLSVEDAVVLLKRLGEMVEQYDDRGEEELFEECIQISEQIIKGVQSNLLHEVFQKVPSDRVIGGIDCRKNRRRLFSIRNLNQCREKMVLFLFSQGTNETQRRGLSLHLQQAIQERVILVNSNTAQLVFGSYHGLVPCHANSCLASLGTSALLLKKDDAKRAALIGECAGISISRTEEIRGMRYLLHGRPENYEDSGPLWIRAYRQSPVWEKMWRFLPDNNQGDWRLIPRELVEQIPQNKWEALTLREIQPREILRRFVEVDFDLLDANCFTPQERETILFASEDEGDAWKRLPFHETLTGQFRDIPEQNAFLESGVALPQACLASAIVFKQSSNTRIRRYQERYLRPLKHRDLVRILLSTPCPSKFCFEILEALPHLEPISDLPGELITLMKDTCWLIDNRQKPIRPADVIFLDRLGDEVVRLAGEIRGVYSAPGLLSEGLRRHDAFELLETNLFSSDDDGLEKLGLLLSEVDRYAVGEVDFKDIQDLKNLLRATHPLPASMDLPAWEIVGKVAYAYGIERCWQFILPAVSRAIKLEKTFEFLNWIRSQTCACGEQDRANYRNAYEKYLEVYAKTEGSRAMLSRIDLLNKEGTWRHSKNLCADAEGVASADLIDDRHKMILRSLIVSAGRTDIADHAHAFEFEADIYEAVRQTAAHLRAYFTSWEDLVAPETIRAFLSLLGDDESLLQLAGAYQGGHSVEWMRDSLPWKVNNRTEADGRQCWLYGMDQHQAIGRHRFIVIPVAGNTVSVMSLTGEPIDVRLDERFETLLVGGLWYETPRDNLILPKIHLRTIDPSRFSVEQLSNFLKNSTEYLLLKAYDQRFHSLDDLWNQIDKAEQLDVRTTQLLVMKHLPYYLKQLGRHRHAKLESAIKRWDDARYRIAEFIDNEEKRREWENREQSALKEIQGLLERDHEVQRAILKAVRAKINDFQYTPASVLFELFQNADDAAVELREIRSYTQIDNPNDELLPDYFRRFVVGVDADSMVVMHWGRPVNYIGGSGFPGREKGYHQDLEKMLILSSSDKPGEDGITGKFGLGFKSVFLIADQPTLISGRLSVDILGGVYLRKSDGCGDLRALLHQETGTGDRLTGTLFKVPFDLVPQDEVLPYYERTAGILPVFAKEIRKLEIEKEGRRESFGWSGQTVWENGENRIEIGKIELIVPQSSQAFEALHFRFHNGGGLLVGTGPQGFKTLPDDLPVIWVVAPTRESFGLGFAVNGNFDVDAGRTRLSGTSQSNEVEGKRLGNHLGACLEAMFGEAHNDWPLFKKRMHLTADLTPYEFWHSVWTVMTRGWVGGLDTTVSGIIRNIFTEDNGLGRLVKGRYALPTGLWTDDFRILTKAGQIRFVLKGVLSQQRIFEKVSCLDFFKDNVSPGSVVADNIHDSLCKVSPSYARKRDQWQSLTLGQILLWMEDSDFRISPETAEVLGQIITLELLENLRGTDGGINEAAHLKEVLKRIKFKTRSGNWYSCRNNLVSDSPAKGVSDDELLRAAFAPDGNILDQSYSETGVMFFATCREKLNATAELMHDWIIQAETIPIQRAALTYLLVGELGERLAELIRRRGLHGTWLANLRSSDPIFEGWGQDDINEVLIRRLCSIDKIGVISGGNEGENLKLDVTETLNSISYWWREKGPEEIKKYDNQTYPGGEIPDLQEDHLGRINRNNWLILFVLGACHTFGLTRRQQHKGFIELCRQKGWWDTFSAEAPETRADQWMSVLDQYIDAQVDVSEYEMWMNRFPAIYRLARDLNDYADIFIDIDRNEEFDNLDQITITRANPNHQVGYYSTPPIKKTLGIGACFVVRELKRAGLIRNKVATPHCYVPVARIRSFMNLLNCPDLDQNQAYTGQSKIIHRFLCEHLGEREAEFQGAFDIPLQIFMERPELQRQMIGKVVNEE
jgi:hypothetical protein